MTMRSVATCGLVLALFAPLAGATRAGQQPPAREASTGTAAISGVAVDATTGRPLPNSIVVIGATGVQARRLLTDAKGRFVFRNIPASSGYQLSATRQGYFPGASVPVAIAEGQWLADRRLELVRHGVLAGTVLDENGEPVVGAPVRILLRTMVAGRPQLASGPLVRTDDRGLYRVSGLREGRYLVEVVSIQQSAPRDPAATTVEGRETSAAPTQLRDDPSVDLDPATRLIVGTFPTPPAVDGRRAYPLTFYPGTPTLEEATDIELAPGAQREGLDIQLRPQPAWSVAGHVDGPAGSAAGMVLRLAPVGLENLAMGNETATTIVDRDGRFTFLNIPDGRYVIDARSAFFEYRYEESAFANSNSLPTPGYSVRSGSSSFFASDSGISYSNQVSSDNQRTGRADIAIAGRDLTGVTVPMTPGVTISGTIGMDDGSALANAITGVALQPADGSPALGVVNGRANQGVFTIAGIRPGRYVVRPSGPHVLSVLWGGRDVTRAPIEITATGAPADLVITFTAKEIALTGRVLGAPADVPLAVIAFPVDRAQWTSYGIQAPYLTSTAVSTSGGFRFSGLPAGDYNLVAVGYPLRNRWNDPKFLEAAATGATTIAVEWGDTKAADVKFRGDVK